MNKEIIHPLRALLIKPPLRVKGVAVCAEEVGVSVNHPEVHAQEGLEFPLARPSIIVWFC
jgi:hypothetical protein